LEYRVDEKYLEKRFSDLWQACSGQNTETVWQNLRSHYQEPHRHYHTLAHIDHCLGQLDIAREQIAEFRATEMAIWFHDVIYHYGAKDNEIRSVDYFCDMAGAAMSEDFVARVSQFIIATQHIGAAADSAIAYVVDIDLSGFGLPWDGYLADSTALRYEAEGVSDEQYYMGKLRFLGELQRWPNLYQSSFFRDRLEANAQSNIARYTRELREQGFGESAICQA
jgi:predicted metal-dependent HD superfamily phosphohydrolase